jgi:hypothetical protein
MTDIIVDAPRRLATVKEALVYAKMGKTKFYEKMNEGAIKGCKRKGERKTLIYLDSIDAMHDREMVPWEPGAAPRIKRTKKRPQ